MFVEFFKWIYEIGCDHLYISVPIMVIVGIYIIAKIYSKISDAISLSKSAAVIKTNTPITYARTSYSNNYYYDDDDDEEEDEEEQDFMADVYRSEMGLFGDEVFYDKAGNKIGYAESGLFGDKTYYDKSGTKVMRGEVGLLGDIVYYDNSYNKVAKSESGLLGDKKIYDKDYHLIGKAESGLFGDKKYTKNN